MHMVLMSDGTWQKVPTSKKLRPAEYTSTKTCVGPTVGSGTSVERDILEGWTSSFTMNALMVVVYDIWIGYIISRSSSLIDYIVLWYYCNIVFLAECKSFTTFINRHK